MNNVIIKLSMSWQMFSIIVCLASYRSVPRFQRFSYAWIASVDDTCILKINSMTFEPRMAGDVGTTFKSFGVSNMFLFSSV